LLGLCADTVYVIFLCARQCDDAQFHSRSNIFVFYAISYCVASHNPCHLNEYFNKIDDASSPYHLDVLDALCELQRMGLVRSVAAVDFPPHLLRRAASYGLEISGGVSVPHNLIRPDGSQKYSDDLYGAATETGTDILPSSPLAGGVLTDRYRLPRGHPDLVRRRRYTGIGSDVVPADYAGGIVRDPEMPSYEMLQRAGVPHGRERGTWDEHRRNLFPVLCDFADRYGVSVAAVALRYALQTGGKWSKGDAVVGSVQVGTTVGHSALENIFGDSRWHNGDLRGALSFQLDDGDLDQLQLAAGKEKVQISIEDVEKADQDKEDDDKSFFIPDLTNTKLWL